MLHADWPPVDLILENNHLGRGDEWVDTEDGIRKVFSVETLNVTVWHVLEFERHRVDDVSFGQLLDTDTYVLKWHYMIRQTGIRTLKGQEARQTDSGREKCAYFFWQGANSSVNEKGASALMTVDLDQERGPQVRVTQGKEPPAFVRLFGGRMVIHRNDKTNSGKPNAKLFIARNEIEAESYLQEITPCVQVRLHEHIKSPHTLTLKHGWTLDSMYVSVSAQSRLVLAAQHGFRSIVRLAWCQVDRRDSSVCFELRPTSRQKVHIPFSHTAKMQ